MQNVKLHYVYREPNFKTVWDLEKEKAITHLIIFLKKPKKKKKKVEENHNLEVQCNTRCKG